MGMRASISFKKGNVESIAFFSHWWGETLFELAEKYKQKLKEDIDRARNTNSPTALERELLVGPLGRLEPETVILDFIRWLVCNGYAENRITSNLYLGKDKKDGDNSDFGHQIIKL